MGYTSGNVLAHAAAPHTIRCNILVFLTNMPPSVSLVILLLYLSYNHSGYSRITVLIGIYQEIRTLPENILSWKDQLIHPLIQQGITVKLIVVLRASGDNLHGRKVNVKAMLKRAIEKSGLIKYVVSTQITDISSETNDFVRKSVEVIHRTGNEVKNPVLPLMLQYAGRIQLGKEMHSFTKNRNESFDYVIYLRSDMFLVSNPWDSKLTTTTTGESQGDSCWVPIFNDRVGYNDRFFIMTASAFRKYYINLENNVYEYFLSKNHSVIGEKLHTYILDKERITVHRTYFCYGVSRVLQCQWSIYGNDACKNLTMNEAKYYFNSKSYMKPNIGYCGHRLVRRQFRIPLPPRQPRFNPRPRPSSHYAPSISLLIVMFLLIVFVVIRFRRRIIQYIVPITQF